jgi:hypothetical protein
MAKKVLLDITLTIGGTDRKAEFSSFKWMINREKVDVKTFGVESDRYELGLATWSFEGNVRPDADMVFIKQLLTAMESGADLAVVYRPLNAAKSTTNPEVGGSVKVQSIPGMGGDLGALQGEGTLTLEGNSAATWDDGAVITIG